MTDKHNEMTNPSMPYFELTREQVFAKGEPGIKDGVTITETGVAKNTITFKREEDITVCLLSFFVHDYVHDYNLGHNHGRVIKGNQQLFESLGITIGNRILKIFLYNITKREAPVMYDDNNFDDIPIESEPKEKQDFMNYFKQFELGIATVGGEKIISTTPFEIQRAKLSELKFKSAKTPDLNQEPINKEDIVPLDDLKSKTPDLKQEQIHKEDMVPSKSILTFMPIEGLDFEKIISVFEKNADFLNFHSSLNIYAVTYLGYDANGSEKGLQNSEGESKNSIMNNAIKSSLDYIINDFSKQQSTEIHFYRDIFKILKLSYDLITDKTNKELKTNPLDILNSSEVLYQFIIFYVSYLHVTDYDDFAKLITPYQRGGVDTPLEEDGEGEEHRNSDVSLSPEIIPENRESIGVPEYVFITHNNLLTTIARGMFIKLDIWNKIFFSEEGKNPAEPNNYIFGIEEINQITYEKLVEIYPIDPEIGGNRNNELLILEILILKRLLIEMSPSKTLTFGAKIDDYLKDYMDTFYFDYFIKNNPIINTNPVEISADIQNNPIFASEAEEHQEADAFFADCDEGCDADKTGSPDFSPDLSGGGPKIKKQKPIEEEGQNEVSETKEDSMIPDITTILATSNLVPPEGIDPNTQEIIFPKIPDIPPSFNKLQKMYQNNIYTIKLLQDSKITPINLDGIEKDNLFDLLSLNETLMHRKGTSFNIPAPRYKFIIDNAAGISSNINGSKFFILNKYLTLISDAITEIRSKILKDDNTIDDTNLSNYIATINSEITQLYNELDNKFIIPIKILRAKQKEDNLSIREINELHHRKNEQKLFERNIISPAENILFLLEKIKENNEYFFNFESNYVKWFKESQPIFGLYRTLKRGVFCPTSSMMDAMDGCSLKYNTTEPKEVGTSYSEIVYENADKSKRISFGGVVLNYEEDVLESKDGVEQRRRELVAKIFYEFNCNNPSNNQINDTVTINTTGIKVSKSDDLKARIAYTGVINKIRNLFYLQEESGEIEVYGGNSQKGGSLEVIRGMWENVQYQINKDNFNNLLSSTALKSMGDYLQECQACFKWGGYINTTEEFPEKLQTMDEINFKFDDVKDKLIYRSVSKKDSIVPYDLNGNGLRLGVQKDRPSGFRSIYILLNGFGAVNDQAITGYMNASGNQNPSRSLLVSRNMGTVNYSGLMGNVIYVTRELPIPDKNSLLRSLEFLNIKDSTIKVQGTEVSPEITQQIIPGSNIDFFEEDDSRKITHKNLLAKIKPFKNSDYEEWINYEEPYEAIKTIGEIEEEQTDQEEARSKRKERAKQNPEEKLRIKAENERVKQEQSIIDKKYKESKLVINNLRTDIPAKDKKMIKTKIPIALLRPDSELYSKISELVEPQILEIIINEAEQEEEERLDRLAKSEEKRKRQEEEETRKAEYEASPERIAAKQAEEEVLRIKQEKEEEELQAKLQAEEEEKQSEKIRIEQEIDVLKSQLESETDEKEKRNINKKIKTLEGKISNLFRIRRHRGGISISNKKTKKYILTKRKNKFVKNGTKLTKRHKKDKIPKKTRKIIK
jgi:hypothetical protein